MIWIAIMRSLGADKSGDNAVIYAPFAIMFISVPAWFIYVYARPFQDSETPVQQKPTRFSSSRSDYLACLKDQELMLEDCLRSDDGELPDKAINLTTSAPVPFPPMDYLMEVKDKKWVGGGETPMDGNDPSVGSAFGPWLKMQRSAALLHKKYAGYYSIITLAPILLYGAGVFLMISMGFPVIIGMFFLLLVILFTYRNITYALFHYRSYRSCLKKSALCSTLAKRLASLEQTVP